MYHFNICFQLRKKYWKNGKTWIDNEVKVSSGKLKDLFFLKNAYPHLTQLYKDAKKKHVDLLLFKRKLYYQSRIFKSTNMLKEVWNVVSDLTYKSKKPKNISIKKNDMLIEDQVEVASALNEFFINAPQKLVNSIPHTLLRNNKCNF